MTPWQINKRLRIPWKPILAISLSLCISLPPLEAEDIILESGFLSKNAEKFPWAVVFSQSAPIANPTGKILVIYNHGSATDDNSEPYCNFLSRLYPLSALVGQSINNQEILVYVVCTNTLSGDLNVKEGSDFPKEYLCGPSKQPGCSPKRYKEMKRREDILKVIDSFIDQGFSKKQIYLAGHSCGGWQTLLLVGRHPDKINGGIALDPGCYGSANWRRNKPNYTKLMKLEIAEISAFAELPVLVFTNKSSSCCGPTTLSWLAGKPLARLIETPAKQKNRFIVGGQVCYFQNTRGTKTQPVTNGHQLNYSACFMRYNSDILKFLSDRIHQ